MAQKEKQLLNSSHSPLGDGRRPKGQSPVVPASLMLVISQWSQPPGTCADPITTAHSHERKGAEQKGN